MSRRLRQPGRWPETLVLYRMRPIVEVRRWASCWGAHSIQRFEGSRFCSRRTLWGFNRLWLGSYWKEEYLWGDRQSGAHLFSHSGKAPDGLIVTRDTSFFKTYCYIIASLESSISLASGTRKRPPQSGSVVCDSPCIITRPYLHQVGRRTFTSKLLSMPSTRLSRWRGGR
jgi:hypothetical protein